MSRFYKFSSKCISYSYDNYKSPYLISDYGIAKVKNESISASVALATEKGPKFNFDNHAKYIKRYKGFCGTLKYEYEEKNNRDIKNNGDLDVDGKNSFYLGRNIIRNGDRKQTYSRACDPAIEFYEANKQFFKNLDIDVPNALIINGGFESNKNTLQRTLIPDSENEFTKLPKMKKIKVFHKAIKIAFRKLQIETIPTPDINELYLQRFSKDTYSGFHYENYYAQRTKGKALVNALEVAKRRWENIDNSFKNREKLERKILFPSTYVIGARNKREISYEVGEELSSRVVHMPEFHVELHTGSWTDPITEQIKNKGRGPIYIGNSISRHERLVNDTKGSISSVEGDVKRFDSRLWMIFKIIAVAMERCYYDIESELVDHHFLAIFDSVGICDYYTPGGYMYRALHGLPSGVKATSTLNSIINLVMQIYFTINFDQKKINYAIGGDDMLIIMFEYNKNVKEEILENCLKVGWEFKILEVKNFNNESFDDRPIFFKYTLDNNDPVVPPKAIYERMLLPWNKRYNTNASILSFLHDLLPSIGAPRTHLLMFYKYYAYIYFSIFKIKLTMADVYLRHEYFYNKVVDKTLREKPVDSELYVLVCNCLSSLDSKPDYRLNKKVFYNKILNTDCKKLVI